MASSSSGQSVSHSESSSNTYIPEYSESPILREIAQHARAMSDVVYNWGMDRFNKNQGDIDGLMRDALSYASPQRIAVDMGMAEAGVQMAAERGRLSAIRDLESYGIDPSSGRYAALDSANRVMSAAAAAGAGNQQRMATQAAGNAMRNQAISAGLQNANFGSQVNRDANAFLQTGMSLKYPPLGRVSSSVSDSKSEQSSSSGDGGGSKSQPPPKEGGGAKQPAAGGAKPAGGGGGAGGGAPQQKDPPPAKPKAPVDEEPIEPKIIPGPKGPEEELVPPNEAGLQPPSPFDDPNNPLVPPDETGLQPPQDDLNDPNAGTLESPSPDDPNYDPGEGTPVSAATEDPFGGLTGPNEEGFQPGDAPYDPYAGQLVGENLFDPNAGGQTGDFGGTTAEDAVDTAGSLYGTGEGGGWTGDVTDAAYYGDGFTGGDSWSDIGQGAMDGSYDAAFDDQQYADEGITDDAYGDLGDQGYGDVGDVGDWGDYNLDDYGGDYGDIGDIGDDAYGDLGDGYDDYSEGAYDDYGGDDYEDWGDEGWGDEGWGDDYEDYGDEGWGDDYEEDYGDEGWGDDYEDYGDDSYEDYADEGWEDDYEDYGDDSYEDYADEDYDDYEDYEDESYDDYEDESYDDYSDDGGDDYYDDSGDYDSGGDEGARGGAVMRGRVERGKRRARIMPPRGPGRPRPRTGYGQRPMRRPRPRFAQGGAVPPGMSQGMPPPGMLQGMGGRPGQRPRLDPPPQAPRPMRGAPMPARGGPRPAPMGRGPRPMPGNMISANGMPPPGQGGMQRPQRMARGGQAGRRAEPTQGGFVSRELSPSNGSTVDDVQARLNAGEFVVPKDVAAWKGKEFFYKLIAQARANRSGGGKPTSPQTGFGNSPGRGTQ